MAVICELKVRGPSGAMAEAFLSTLFRILVLSSIGLCRNGVISRGRHGDSDSSLCAAERVR